MIAESQIVLFRFPQTDQTEGKFRPALVLRRLPRQHNDWMIYMISYNFIKKFLTLMKLSRLLMQISSSLA